MKTRKIYFSDSQKSYLREHYPTEPASDIADVLGVSAPVVIRIAREMGLEKVKGWNANLFHGRYVNRYSGRRAVA